MPTNTHLSTFKGVFTPTIVTILGVIMYLRQGWLVGNGGLLGAWLVLIICLFITTTTALSLSSMATNVRLHAGGAYSIISRSLGKETGGAVGFMLYLAQSLAIVMYIFGFREGWLGLFPTHSPFLIDVLCFVAMMIIVRFFRDLAFQLQYLIFGITILSVLSVSKQPFETRWEDINWIGNFGGEYRQFWSVLAVYFPALTGILAGSSLSGDLKDPRESIPIGTLSAVVVGGIVYAWLAIVYAGIPQQTLLNNYNIMQEISIFPPMIGVAVVGATFCAGLATLVGAPKIFLALCDDNILPRSSFFKQHYNPLWLTGGIVMIGILLRDLNSIAPVITICFLTTYGTINLIVLIEQQLGLLSFRPTLKLPKWIPLFGSMGCIIIALVVNPTLSLLVVCILTLGYRRLSNLHQGVRQDVRTNLFFAMARWAARKSLEDRAVEGKAWMPHPIVPLFSGPNEDNQALLQLANDISLPKGSVRILSLGELNELPFAKTLFVQQSALESDRPEHAIFCALQTLTGTFLQPNIFCLDATQREWFTDLNSLWKLNIENDIGIVYRLHKPHTIDPDNVIHVWIRPQGPHWDLDVARKEGSLDLALLMAIQLAQSRNLPVRLLTTLSTPEEHKGAEEYLDGLVNLGRLPKDTTALAFVGDIWSALPQAPRAQIQIFGIPNPKTSQSTEFVDRISAETVGTSLFVCGVGKESLLA